MPGAISIASRRSSTTTSTGRSTGRCRCFPFAGARRGKVAVLEALGGIAKEYQLERYEPKIIVVEGDRAAVMSEVAFKQRATDRTHELPACELPAPEDGRVIEFREFANSFDLVEQALGRFIPVG